MKFTATQLVTFWTCPFLWHVSYEVKEPLPVWGTRRRFGNVIHAAIAEYERRGWSLEKALQILEDQQAGLTVQDLEETRSILAWRHGRARDRGKDASCSWKAPYGPTWAATAWMSGWIAWTAWGRSFAWPSTRAGRPWIRVRFASSS